MRRSRWWRWAGLVIGAGLLAACASTPAPSGGATAAAGPSPVVSAAPSASAGASTNATLQGLIAGARQEGALTLSWRSDSFGGTDGMAQLASAFNASYGLSLAVQYTPGPTDVDASAQAVQEYQAGRTATTDIYRGTASPLQPLMQAGALLPVDWTSWAPNVTNPRSVAPGNGAVSVQTQIPGITYNSSALSGDAVPHSMQDLLKPQYKGLIASTPYASNFDTLAAMWGDQKALDYAKALSGQLGGLIACGSPERLLSGEFSIFAIDCYNGSTLKEKAQGEPLDFVIPADAPIMDDKYLAVLKNAAHPDAAQLWINFMLSRQAQDMIYGWDYMDSDLVEGSKTAALIQASGLQEGSFTRVDASFYQTHDAADLAGVTKQVVDLFQGQ